MLSTYTTAITPPNHTKASFSGSLATKASAIEAK